MNIKGNIEIEELGIKRLYLEGLNIESECPKCRKFVKFGGYMSYPRIGYPDKMHFYHEDCEES